MTVACVAAAAAAAAAVAAAARYRLPAKEGMSPLLYALPGKLVPGQSVVKPPERKPWVIGIVDTVFATASQAVAQLIDSNNGGRTLIRELTPDGRGKVARGAFIGYVAVSQPIGPEQEVDVAIVWRGTIFREEWESNFVQDRLVSMLGTQRPRLFPQHCSRCARNLAVDG
jgi:hypothetical protein